MNNPVIFFVVTLALVASAILFVVESKPAVGETRRQNSEEIRMPKNDSLFWVVGKKYFVRTVTMYLTGELVRVEGPNNSELIFKDAAWVACTKRFAETLKTGEIEEVEPYPEGKHVLVNRSSIIDAAEWEHDLPRAQLPAPK